MHFPAIYTHSIRKLISGQPAGVLRSSGASWIWIALILFWSSELTLLQHWTCTPATDLQFLKLIKDGVRRCILNTAGCSAMILLLPRWCLRCVFISGFLISNGLIVYANYFRTPLSWTVLSNQWREGVSVSDHGWSTINLLTVAICGFALLAKIVLHSVAGKKQIAFRKRLKFGSAAAIGYVAVGTLFAGYYKPISKIRFGNPEYYFGYTIAWVAEACQLDMEMLLDRSLAMANRDSVLVNKTEERFELGRHVAIIQVESMDFDALRTKVDGEWVMPFLQEISKESMCYSVIPFHSVGSCEADFSFLTSSTPNGLVNPFLINDFPYDAVLPRIAAAAGYDMVSFHGNTGEFFNRRAAYEKMGFGQLYFDEELSKYNVSGQWDDELLKFSSDLLNQSSNPTIHFVITITSHGPFNKLRPEQRELFPSPASVQQNYLNSMRYVDNAIAGYVDQLPDDTTVILYGDHESNVPNYYDGPADQTNHVPWLIYRKGQDVSVFQRSMQTGLAMSGELTQLDMACYVRDLLLASSPSASIANINSKTDLVVRSADANSKLPVISKTR